MGRRMKHTEGCLSPFTRYEDDPECQMYVEAFPSGMTADEIAEAFGCTRQNVEIILSSAMAKLDAVKHTLPSLDEILYDERFDIYG